MGEIADDYQKLRDATAGLREQLDAIKSGDTTVESLDLKLVEVLLVDKEKHFRSVDRMVEWMNAGGPQELGAAMESDFARLRSLGEG